MGDREFKLTALAGLEGANADRAWADVQKDYAKEIKKYFKSIKSVVSVDPVKGLEETIRWARQKLTKIINYEKKKKKKVLLGLPEYLLDIAGFVHELALVDLFRDNTEKSELAWAEILKKVSTDLRAYIEKNNRNHFFETENFFLKTVERARNNLLLDGKFKPEKGELKNHFLNIAKDVLRERPPPPIEIHVADLGNDENSTIDWPIDPPDIPSGMVAQELLKVILEFGGKPHTILAFGFTRLLDVKTEYFVRDYSDDILGELASIFCEEYYNFWIPYLDFSFYQKKCCGNFLYKLEDTVGKEYKPTTRYFKNLIPLSNRKVGAVPIRPFYGRNPTSSVSYWCDDVKNALENKYNLNQEGILQAKSGDEKLE